jgi:hypothetical protein
MALSNPVANAASAYLSDAGGKTAQCAVLKSPHMCGLPLLILLLLLLFLALYLFLGLALLCQTVFNLSIK